MGRRGPTPKPTALKKLEGTAKYHKERRSTNEAEPEITIPSPPEFLSDVGKKEWERASKELYELGLLSRVDRSAFTAYCQAYSDWIEASRVVEEEGMTFLSPNGHITVHPTIAIKHKARDDVMKYLQQFGMTPASRTRINAEPPKKEQKLTGLAKLIA